MKKKISRFLALPAIGAMLMCVWVGCDVLDTDIIKNRVKTVEFYECEDSLVVDVFTLDRASANSSGYYMLRGVSVLRCQVSPSSAAADLDLANFQVLTSIDTTKQNELDKKISVKNRTVIDTAVVYSIQNEGNGVFKLFVRYKYGNVAKFQAMKNCIQSSSISIGVKNRYTDNVHTPYKQNKLNNHDNVLNWVLYDGTQAINPKGNFATVHDRIYSTPWATAPADSKTTLLKDYDFYFTSQDINNYSDNCTSIGGTPYITTQMANDMFDMGFVGVHKDKYDANTSTYDALETVGDANGSLKLEHSATFKQTEKGWYNIDEALPTAQIATAYKAYQDHTVYVVEEYSLNCGSLYFPTGNNSIKVKAAYTVRN